MHINERTAAKMPQKILVTAGASGIGRAIAAAFTAEGAAVHVADIDGGAIERLKHDHPSISATVADISRGSDVSRLFEDVTRTMGGLDVLVNNAGVSGPAQPAEDYDLEAWEQVLAVNLTGTFRTTQAAIPLLKQSDSASIIIMNALAGRFGYPNRAAYSTSKWGLAGMAKTLSMELGPAGITVNSVHPGAVAGDRFDAVLEGRAALSGRTVDEELELAMDLQSVKRLTQPEDIAALVIFLAGPHGRSISGQSIPIDGDSKSTA
ncbi:NAD(P)-dependent dehydrogenase (short-subunit alcohol dehydrogenase family) [Arthrobacter bambusae]|uniref:NAD(P)-dependent dehydrogenase (Short-subunit alcohol dehydrogenase family) n=1 Tax=Arthrobacter bambusae TaxID=1338426 RepID=A0ABV2P0X3_9MICC